MSSLKVVSPASVGLDGKVMGNIRDYLKKTVCRTR
ncbi:MAG: hypothetical protein CM1200mP12_00980 [Gammaproteobacteria bacterium]|nr:MAG: hypothetical protein CM1200mP12_00980 [Gammaproteobacteria bacterium]